MRSVLVVCVLVVTAGQASGEHLQPPPVMPRLEFAPAQVDTAPSVQSARELKSTMRRVGAEEVSALRRWQRTKSPRVAIFSNMLLPGLGQLYNGRRWKTAVMVGFATYYGGSAWVEHRKSEARRVKRDRLTSGSLEWQQQNLFYEFHKENSIDFVWWSGAVWLIGVLDAFVDAHLYDVRSVDPTIFRGSSHNSYVGLSLRM
ncbi:MAG: DUF5683 domain-containing protein [Candidatus Krumholzibacteria bacterium]|nr:DUF5683 domain-containing protein [Candidatus Krumholzibacteria bacterium]